LALDDLDKGDITEIRSFATPPEPVQIVCECVVIIKGIKEVSWKSARGMMSDSSFLRSLKELNCDAITQKQVSNVRAHMKRYKKWDEMQQISKAGFGLLRFVRAVLSYCDVFREVKPKKERVEFLEAELNSQVKLLNRLNSEIDKLETQLNALNDRYLEANKEKQLLTEMLEQAERRKAAADKLITGLMSEKARWTVDLGLLKQEKVTMIGTSLIAASFIAYTGPFSWEFRKAMIFDDWLVDIGAKLIPIVTPFSLKSFLSSDVEITT
jgi:dynein heavy chain, axonemal